MDVRKPVKIDKTDRKILRELTLNCDIPLLKLARKVGLSQTPCWQRVQKLEQAGIIRKRVAIIDPQSLGLGLTVIVAVEAHEHSAAWLQGFRAYLDARPEVTHVWRMAGEVDYMLKLVIADMKAYDEFYKALIEAIPLKNVSSRFVMETVKESTGYAIPIDA